MIDEKESRTIPTPPPTLGDYLNTALPLSTNATVTPNAAPTNTTNISVSTSTNFKGKLEGYPATGVVRVTDAHPAGTYTVTVRAFNSPSSATTKTFTLTVTTPAVCMPVSFALASNFSGDSFPFAIAVGDFNGDGRQDLAVANDSFGSVSILLGDGAGGFGIPTNLNGVAYVSSVAVGDFNGDGKEDLAVTNEQTSVSEAYVSVLFGDGVGGFGPIHNFPLGVGTAPESVAIGDFNGDGKQDLAVANTFANNVSILLGDGVGNFGAAINSRVGNGPTSVVVADFNGDGKQDLVVVNEFSNDVAILLGDGAGSFGAVNNFVVGTHPVAVTVGDFNGDGKQDLAVANADADNISIVLGDGAGSFGAATNFAAGFTPRSVVLGDFNGDTKQDLAVADGNTIFGQPYNISLLLGDGTGAFGSATKFNVGDRPSSLVVGDFNGDGRQDLAVVNHDSDDISILLRNCPTPTPTPSCPTTLIVNDNGDASDATPGDGGCATSGGVCTLRAAIQEANALSACAAIDINFSLSTPNRINLSSALPAINHNININGPGPNLLTMQRSTASGTPNFRIFTLRNVTVNISGVTISGGSLAGSGGGIRNLGTFALTNSIVSGNSAGSGGGILNDGTAVTVVTNSKISGNNGGGIANYDHGTITLMNSTVSSNTSRSGGGISNPIGTVTLTNSTVSGNVASDDNGGGGGGIYNNAGTITLINSAVIGNISRNTGGGLVTGTGGELRLISTSVSANTASYLGGGINTEGTTSLVNSTVSGNNGTSGGGIYNGSIATLVLTNSTVSANSATNGDGGGIRAANVVDIRNTIIANNRCTGIGPDLNGAINSQDYNLIANTSGATFAGTTTHNITNVNAMLGPLANNGGPTQTHALLPSSPAIDAGDNTAVTNPPFAGPPFTDQRGAGFNRIADGDGNGTATVDIGAYELQGVLTIDRPNPLAGRTSGGQQITLYGAFANLSTLTIGGNSASWSYTNAGDISAITVTTPAHAVGAVQITLTPTTGSPYSKANAFAYLPTVFTDDTIVVGQTTAKAQHVIELRQAVDALRAVAGLSGPPWTDPGLSSGNTIRAIHILELRIFLDDAATRLGYSTSPYTDSGLTSGFPIKRIHIEELRQRIRTIAG